MFLKTQHPKDALEQQSSFKPQPHHSGQSQAKEEQLIILGHHLDSGGLLLEEVITKTQPLVHTPCWQHVRARLGGSHVCHVVSKEPHGTLQVNLPFKGLDLSSCLLQGPAQG